MPFKKLFFSLRSPFLEGSKNETESKLFPISWYTAAPLGVSTSEFGTRKHFSELIAVNVYTVVFGIRLWWNVPLMLAEVEGMSSNYWKWLFTVVSRSDSGNCFLCIYFCCFVFSRTFCNIKEIKIIKNSFNLHILNLGCLGLRLLLWIGEKFFRTHFPGLN